MSNIKTLEMAGAVSSKNYISIKKSFLGLSEKVIYEPTSSRVRAVRQEYSADEGKQLEQLMSLPLSRLEAELNAKGKPATSAVGSYQLQACLSDDRQFCAVQLFRFYDFMYHPLSDPRFFEGKEAETVSKLLG